MAGADSPRASRGERLTHGSPSTPDRLDRPLHDPLLYELFPALATGVEWALERTERALARVGDPHRTYASLHVGGTNGKGSVTTTLASVQQRRGLRTGCYVSPHLVSFRERIRVDGEALSEDALREYAAQVRDAVSAEGLTFFEAVTVLALHAFAREKVEVAALEVGLGGRLDSTNVVTPEVSAVTNVAMDHADYLGDTLLDIAREKAGIVKTGVPFCTTESAPEVLALFARTAEAAGAPFWPVPATAIQAVEVDAGGTSFRVRTRSWGELDLRTPLVGTHQATNAALAVEMCEHLTGRLKPTADDFRRGLADVSYHGRDELMVLDGRTWLFDVAHNAAGMASLADTLDRLALPRPVVALVGVLADKDWRAMVPPLLERCTHTLLTVPPKAPPERRWDPEEAARALATIATTGAAPRAVSAFDAALAEAAGLAGTGTVVVTGSVLTVGAAMRRLGVAPVA